MTEVHLACTFEISVREPWIGKKFWEFVDKIPIDPELEEHGYPPNVEIRPCPLNSQWYSIVNLTDYGFLEITVLDRPYVEKDPDTPISIKVYPNIPQYVFLDNFSKLLKDMGFEKLEYKDYGEQIDVLINNLQLMKNHVVVAEK